MRPDLQVQQRSLARPACAGCRHFESSPVQLEARLPGLATLSSGFAAVRAADGLCTLHDRYLSAGYSCAEFSPPP